MKTFATLALVVVVLTLAFLGKAVRATDIIAPVIVGQHCFADEPNVCGSKGITGAFFSFTKPAYFQKAYFSASVSRSSNNMYAGNGIWIDSKTNTCASTTKALWQSSGQNTGGTFLASGGASNIDVTNVAKKSSSNVLFYFAGSYYYTCPASWTIRFENASTTAPPFAYAFSELTQTGSATDSANVTFESLVTGNATGTCVYAWSGSDVQGASVSQTDWDGVTSATTPVTVNFTTRTVEWACDFDANANYTLSLLTPPVLVNARGWVTVSQSATLEQKRRLVEIKNPTNFSYADIQAALSCPDAPTHCDSTTFNVGSLGPHASTFQTQTWFVTITTPTPTPLPRIMTDPNAPKPQGFQWFSPDETSAAPTNAASSPTLNDNVIPGSQGGSALSFATADTVSRAFVVLKPNDSQALPPGPLGFAIFDSTHNAVNTATLTTPSDEREQLTADAAGGFTATLNAAGDYTVEWANRNGGSVERAVVHVQSQQPALLSDNSQPPTPLFASLATSSPNHDAQSFSFEKLGTFSFPVLNPNTLGLAAALIGALLIGVGVAQRREKRVLSPVRFGDTLTYSIPANSTLFSKNNGVTHLQVLVPSHKRLTGTTPKAKTDGLLTGTLVDWPVDKPFGTIKALQFQLKTKPGFDANEPLPLGELV